MMMMMMLHHLKAHFILTHIPTHPRIITPNTTTDSRRMYSYPSAQGQAQGQGNPPTAASPAPPPPLPPPRRTLVCAHPTLPCVRSQPPKALPTRQSRVMAPDMSFSCRSHRTGSGGRGFCHPPSNPAGLLFDASDRRLLCLSLSKDEEEMVVGSADHALYAYSLKNLKPTRKLYTKTHGHIDWVSCVAHMDDGRILSGGGDGKVCLWPAARPSSSPSSFLMRGGGSTAGSDAGGGRPAASSNSLTVCEDLDGHASAVSKILPLADSQMAFSSGYDGLIKLWNLTSKRTLTFEAGSASRDIAVTDNSPGSRSALDPVMDFCVDIEKEQLVSGTRKGTCNIWDLQTAQQVGALKAAHRGPVSCMMRWSASLIVTGGQDGTVKILDTRRGMPLVAHKVNCHVDPTQGTTGAVSCLEKAGGLLATGGADNRVCLLDPRMNFQPLHVFNHHNAPVFSLKYALAAESPVLFTGAADGVLHCVNLLSRQVLYRLFTQGAVRAIASTTTHLQENKVVVACEDGKAVVFSF